MVWDRWGFISARMGCVRLWVALDSIYFVVSRCAFPLVFPLFLAHGTTHRDVPFLALPLWSWILHCHHGLRVIPCTGGTGVQGQLRNVDSCKEY